MRQRALETNRLGTKEVSCTNHRREDRAFAASHSAESTHHMQKFRVQKLFFQIQKGDLVPPGRIHYEKVPKSLFPLSECATSGTLSATSRAPRFRGRVHTMAMSSPTWTRSNPCQFFLFSQTDTKKNLPDPFLNSCFPTYNHLFREAHWWQLSSNSEDDIMI